MFRVKRIANFYVWRAILPLTFIVLMPWAVFWIDPDMVGVQISLAATSVLTLIAFLFSLQSMLPMLSFLTRLDKFLFASLALVFIAFAEAVATAVLAKHERGTLAVAIDRWARWSYPFALGLVHLVASTGSP